MKQLEKRNLKLENSIDLIEKQFNSIMNSKEYNVTSKFIDVLRRNNGYQEIKLISKILNGKHNLAGQLEYDHSANEINAFSFAPLTSVDVERSFSIFKALYSSRKHQFTFENLKMTFLSIVIQIV